MDTAIETLADSTTEDAKPLRVGIIGCGGISQTHIRYLTKNPGVSIVCGADINPAALDRMTNTHGVTRVYADYKEMLRDMGDEVDAISVCAPNGIHAEAAIAAAEAGKHVLCEKPMALNAKLAQTMADAAKKSGVEFVIGFQHRFEPRSQVLRDMVQSGALGDILYVRAQALRRRGIPNWGVFGQKELQGGGPLIDIGVHILEASHSIIGTPKPVSATGNTFTYLGNTKSDVVSEWAGWDYKTYTVEDLAVGMIRFDNGTMLTLESSFVAHIPDNVFNIQIMGTKGGAIWDGSQIFTDFHGYMVNTEVSFIGKRDMWDYKLKHFVEVARDGRTNEAPPEHGIMVQKMLDGIYASASAGKEVAID